MKIKGEDLANKTGINHLILKDILKKLLTIQNQEREKKPEEDTPCSKHVFVVLDEKKIEDEMIKFKGYKEEENWYKLNPGSHAEYCQKEKVAEYYPPVDYEYCIYQCAHCQKVFIGVKIGQDAEELILDLSREKPSSMEYTLYNLQLAELKERDVECDLISEYQKVDFTEVLKKMILVDDIKGQKELFQKISELIKANATPEGKIESLMQLEREYTEAIEQSESYKKLQKEIEDFKRWLV